MTGSWIIIRCEVQKEFFVAAAIARKGYDAWVPAQVVRCRGKSRRKTSAKALITTEDQPILSKTLFAAIPVSAYGDIASVRYLTGLERGVDSVPYAIPASQIKVFMATIDKMNQKTLDNVRKAMTKKQKAGWVNIKEALLALKGGVEQEQEIAA